MRPVAGPGPCPGRRCAVFRRLPRSWTRSEEGERSSGGDVENPRPAPSPGGRRPEWVAPAPRRTTMAKYLLLKHYRGAPASVNDAPMEKWTP
ncbi:hypothetical protein GT039_38955, partial [Streptomyces sp. SID2955]|nr:hypothetical protein [Streptomyces sp. SID2955]